MHLLITPGLHSGVQLPRKSTDQGLLSPSSATQNTRRGTNTLQKSLETIYGIGNQHSSRILAKFHIIPSAKIGSLPSKTINDLTAELSSMTIENDLRRKVQDNIKRLRDMGSYRGRRHAMGLPVRGQRTRSQVCFGR